MPCEIKLNRFEVRKIWNLKERDMSIRIMATPVKRSKGAVENVIKRAIGGCVKKSTRSKPKLCQRIGD